MAILLIVLVGIFLINYQAAFGLLAGILIAWLLVMGYRYLRVRMSRRVMMLMLIPFICLIVVAFLLVIINATDFSGAMALPEEDATPPEESLVTFPEIKEYRVTIEPADAVPQSFVVKEEILYDLTLGTEIVETDQLYIADTRTVSSQPHGFMLREVEIAPLEADPRTPAEVTLPGSGTPTVTLCSSTGCPPAIVTLVDLPQNSYYDARGGEFVQTEQYVTGETIVFTNLNMERGINFAYVPTPFTVLRPVAGFFIGARTLSEWAAGLIGLIGAIVSMPLIRPIIEEALQKYIVDNLRKLLKLDEDDAQPAY